MERIRNVAVGFHQSPSCIENERNPQDADNHGKTHHGILPHTVSQDQGVVKQGPHDEDAGMPLLMCRNPELKPNEEHQRDAEQTNIGDRPIVPINQLDRCTQVSGG